MEGMNIITAPGAVSVPNGPIKVSLFDEGAEVENQGFLVTVKNSGSTCSTIKLRGSSIKHMVISTTLIT